MVTSGQYSDYCIRAIFDNKRAAETMVANKVNSKDPWDDDYEIDERELESACPSIYEVESAALDARVKGHDA